MILFMLLALIALVLITVVVTAIGIGGSAFIIIFGDVIVCIAIIIWLISRFFKKK